MNRRPFSKTALIAEFLRTNGSGIAEEEVMKPAIRTVLINQIRERLKAQRLVDRRRERKATVAIDLKRLQANDRD